VGNLSRLVPDNLFAGDEIGVPQPYLPAGSKAEELFRMIFHEVLLEINHPPFIQEVTKVPVMFKPISLGCLNEAVDGGTGS